MVADLYNGANFGGADLSGALAMVKVRADGSHLWSRAYGAAATSVDHLKVIVTGQGNLLVVGSFNGTLDLGTGPLPHTHGMFIAKFSPNGTPVWSHAFEATDESGSDTYGMQPHGLATDANGSLLVSGQFMGYTSFGGATLWSGPVMYGSFSWSGGTFTLEPQVSYNVILGVLSTSGGDRWFQHLKHLSAPRLDAEGGSLVLSADQYPATDVGGGRLHPPINGHAFVARYTMGGAFGWARVLANAGQSPHVTLLPDGKTVGVRSFYERLSFDQKTWQSNGGSDLLFFSVGP